jgi:hypothetical protein
MYIRIKLESWTKLRAQSYPIEPKIEETMHIQGQTK